MVRGRAWRFGDSVNTDAIISGKYKFKTLDLDELSKHAMESIAPDFAKKVRYGDIIVAGENFGCGSSREQAPLVLKHLGIGCIVAKSFARIFYRNAINVGLPVIESEEIFSETDAGDVLEVDLEKGIVKNVSRKKTFNTRPLPKFLLEILKDGGLVEHFKKWKKFKWAP